MSKRILLLLLVVLVVALTMGLAGADACPPKSKNPGGTPPNCGHPSQQPAGCAETGPVSGFVRTRVEPIDPTGGHSGSPTGGGLVHRVNCTVVWDLLDL